MEEGAHGGVNDARLILKVAEEKLEVAQARFDELVDKLEQAESNPEKNINKINRLTRQVELQMNSVEASTQAVHSAQSVLSAYELTIADQVMAQHDEDMMIGGGRPQTPPDYESAYTDGASEYDAESYGESSGKFPRDMLQYEMEAEEQQYHDGGGVRDPRREGGQAPQFTPEDDSHRYEQRQQQDQPRRQQRQRAPLEEDLPPSERLSPGGPSPRRSPRHRGEDISAIPGIPPYSQPTHQAQQHALQQQQTPSQQPAVVDYEEKQTPRQQQQLSRANIREPKRGGSGSLPRSRLSFSEDRRVEVERIEDMQQKWSFFQGTNPLGRFVQLRSEADYVKFYTFNKDTILRTRLVWQQDPIPRTLIKIDGSYCSGDTDKAKHLRDEGVANFLDIQRAMRDRFDEDDHTVYALKVLQRGIDEPMLRDEILCQIIKQTTQNMDETSVILGWKLFYLALSCWPPSKALLLYVTDHIVTVATPVLRSRMPFDTVRNIAANCFKTRERVRAKTRPPTLTEIQCLLRDDGKYTLQIECAGYDPFFHPFIRGDTYSLTVQEVSTRIAEHFGIDNQPREDYDICVIFMSEAEVAPTYEVLLKHTAEMNAVLSNAERDIANNPDISFRLMFRKRLWSRSDCNPRPGDIKYIDFLYKQIIFANVTEGKFNFEPKKLAKLGAFQCKVEEKGKELTYSDIQDLSLYDLIPRSIIERFGVPSLMEVVSREMERLNAQETTLDGTGWQLHYISNFAIHPLFGSTTFKGQLVEIATEGSKVPSYSPFRKPQWISLAISWRGIFLCDENFSQVNKRFDLDSIVNTKVESHSFKFGIQAKRLAMYHFETANGKKILDSIQYHTYMGNTDPSIDPWVENAPISEDLTNQYNTQAESQANNYTPRSAMSSTTDGAPPPPSEDF